MTTDKGLAKEYGSLAKKIKQRMHQLKSADNLAVLAKLPVLGLHQHKGKNKGIWSIDIHKNWRIFFKIGQDPIPILEDGDLHIKKVSIIRIGSITDPH